MYRTAAVLAVVTVVACQDATQPAPPPLPTAQAAAGSGDYELVALGSLPLPAGFASEPRDINNRGQIVGWSGPGLPGSVRHAFLWEDGVMTDLGTLGGRDSRAEFINETGQVAGWSSPAGGGTNAFLWEDGVMQDLGNLGGSVTRPTGLNAGGAVVGFGTTASGATHAFLARDGQMQDLGTLGGDFSTAVAVSNRGQVVGTSTTATCDEHAFLWDAGSLHDLGTLGGSSSAASAISEAGAVTGRSTDSAGGSRAFVWEGGVMQALPGGPSGDGIAITNSGIVAGTIDNGSGTHGVVWMSGQAIDLGSLFPPLPRTFVVRMNERGQVVGFSNTSGSVSSAHTILWEDGVLRDLGSLVAANSFPNALNASGDVVGVFTGGTPTPDTFHGVLWRRRPGGPMR